MIQKVVQYTRPTGYRHAVYSRRCCVHLVARVVRHRVVIEVSSIVIGRIPNCTIIQGKGISPDTDAIGVSISSPDRVLEHQRCAIVAWRICRRLVVVTNSKGEGWIAACVVNDDRLSENDWQC